MQEIIGNILDVLTLAFLVAGMLIVLVAGVVIVALCFERGAPWNWKD